jgi:hypothetical protein
MSTSLHTTCILGAQFACFTGTKVQILTQSDLRISEPEWIELPSMNVLVMQQDEQVRTSLYPCFTGTKVQPVMQQQKKKSRFSLYLLYWYKSTNSDAARTAAWGDSEWGR